MVAGRLQEKNGFYYIVLSYTDSAGKRRQPWIGTGLPVKGNKKRAEKMLADTRKDFTIPKGQVSELSPDMAFSDYMRYWLKMMRTAVTETTYSSYCFNVEKHIIPYFEPLGVTLAGLQPRQIQSFYLHEAETLKNTSILRFHANLHKALKYAVRIDLIASNPVDKVDHPKPQAFMASYYSAEEMEKLFEAAQGHIKRIHFIDNSNICWMYVFVCFFVHCSCKHLCIQLANISLFCDTGRLQSGNSYSWRWRYNIF